MIIIYHMILVKLIPGYYMYVTDNNKAGSSARMFSPTQFAPRGRPVCLTFWFHMFGGTSGSLNVYLTSGETRLPVWSRSGSHANVWRKGQRTLTSKTDYQVRLYILGTSSNIMKTRSYLCVSDVYLGKGDMIL